MIDHKHLLIDCYVKKPLTDVEYTKQWLEKIVTSIDMQIVAGPIVAYCDAEGNYGITGACCIQTSHCSIHVWDSVEKPYMRLDVYSCKEFDQNVIISHLDEFDPYDMKVIILNRNPT